jgi:hypothetical protein
MLRGALIGVLAVGLVCMVTLSLIGWAAPAPSKPETPPPATTVPMPNIPTLLQANGILFTDITNKANNGPPTYRAMVELDDVVTVVVCVEEPGTLSFRDGSNAKCIHMYAQITPTYTQDTPPSVAFLRTALEHANNMRFVTYTLETDQDTGQWTVFLDTCLFLKGATPELFDGSLLLLVDGAVKGKNKLLPLMKTK